MGGSAFGAVLEAAVFPRIPPIVYNDLKARLFPKLAELYTWVGIPIEAPEKLNHGDLDFLVAAPKTQSAESLSHQMIKETLGATFMIPMEGNRTSNYAVPISPGEWAPFGHSAEEDDKRSKVNDGQIFYQVDVHVCMDKDEWDRIMFYHSYGDLGMILGVVGRNAGLSFGSKGLKLPDPPYPPFDLSESFDDIIRFFGLSLSTYDTGFKTKLAIFEWVATSRLFDAKRFRSEGSGFTKVKPERKMYAEFVEWVGKQRNMSECGQSQRLVLGETQATVQVEALVFFKKKEAYDALVLERSNRIRLKEIFSGSIVRDWADMGGYWKGVKLIMDEVRVRLGGEEGILTFLNKNGEQGLKDFVIQVKEENKIQMWIL
ncbi:hypothetical protein BYT27DRAFT_7202663 [Phlegmacium glaucopus]|nr:hypothetical protein BYT27DRAFT_7202663 [Phlegmacium glaucopus]